MRGSECVQIHAMPPVCWAVRLAFSPYQPYFICILQRTRLMPRKSHADEWKPHSPGMCISLKSLPLLFTTIPWIWGQKKIFFKIAKPKNKGGLRVWKWWRLSEWNRENEKWIPSSTQRLCLSTHRSYPTSSTKFWRNMFFLMFPFCGLSC